MELHRTDEERVEALKKWWAENGRMLIVGLVVGIGGVGGWTYWQDHQRGRAEAASALFQEASEAAAAGNHGRLSEAGNALLNEHPDVGYAAAVSLMLARAAFDDGQPERAMAHLQWVVDNAALPELRGIARLRLAEIAFGNRAFQEAISHLDAIESGPVSAAGHELRGDIHHARGETDLARESWESAAAEHAGSAVGRQRLTLKLGDLGRLNSPGQP